MSKVGAFFDLPTPTELGIPHSPLSGEIKDPRNLVEEEEKLYLQIYIR